MPSAQPAAKTPRGFSIIEALLAVAVFGVIAAGTLGIVAGPLSSSGSSSDHQRAVFLAEEGVEATRSVRNDAWTNLTNGSHGLVKTTKWTFSGTSDVNGNFTRVIVVADVSRNGSGDIVTSGGTVDPRTKKITATVTWPTLAGFTKSVSSAAYLTDWSAYDWTQDTDTHFGAGTTFQTTVSGTGSAATIELAAAAAKTWDPDGGSTTMHTTDDHWKGTSFQNTFVDDTPGEFNAGSYTLNTQYNGTGNWVELTSGGKTAGTGTFTSRVYDAGAAGSWTSFAWSDAFPSGKTLPSAKATESSYSSGNVDMSTSPFLYRFDENAGATSFADVSGNGYNASCSGTCPTAGVTGKFANAVTFNGTTQYVTASTDLAALLGGTVSVSFWVKTTQAGNDTMWQAPGITGVEQSGGGNDIFWGWIDATGHIGVQAGNTAGAKSTSAINNNVWHHVALTRDATSGQTKVYVDGALQSTATSEVGAKTTTFSNIGRIDDTGGTPVYYSGSLDEFTAFQGVVLSDAQAQSLYQRGAARLKLQIRSCPGSTCASGTFVGPDGTVATYFTEATTTGTGFPSFTISSGVPTNRYAQYRVTLETDSTTLTPELTTVSFLGSAATGTPVFSGTVVSGTGIPSSVIEVATNAWTAPSQGTIYTHTSDTDFSPGTFTSTVTVGTGSGAGVDLTTAYDWRAATQATTDAYNGVATVSSTDAWAVGAGGVISHWNGTAWSTATSPVTNNLFSVQCLTTSNCWAVGASGKILRWNGTSWSEFVDTGNEQWNAVKLVTATDAWVVANGGSIRRWNGTAWNTVTSPVTNNLFSVACVTATDCWSVGASGKILHWNGTAWSEFVDTGNTQWNFVRMASASLGWVVGNGGDIYQYNGTSWSAITSPVTNNLLALNVVSATDAWAVGASGKILHWNGSSWSEYVDVGNSALNNIDMASSTFGILVGAGGTTYHYGLGYAASGTYERIIDAGSSVTWGQLSWSRTLPTSTTLTMSTRTGNTAVPDGSWSSYTAGSAVNTGISVSSPAGRYIQYRATLASTDPTVTPELQDVTITHSQPIQNQLAVTMISATDGWSVGQTGEISRYDGTAWAPVASPTTQNLQGVHCLSSTDCWAVASAGQIIRWNGTSWSNVVDTGAQNFRSVKMVATNDVWAVANSGQIYHWNGTAWAQTIDLGSHTFSGVDCVSASDCWAVANSGRIVRYSGGTWSDFVDNGNQTYNGVDMVASNDAWAVGDGGEIWHWNGTVWSSVTSPTGSNLENVTCASASACWAAGQGGTIVSWDGVSWSVVSSPTSSLLNGIYAFSAGDVWAVGNGPTFVHYTGAYSASATYTGAVIDAGTSVTWNTVLWTLTAPATTGITVATRSGPTPTPDGSWSAFSSELTNAGGSTITSAANRYLQYRATFTSGNLLNTATLDDLTIVYARPTGANLYGTSGVDVSNVWAVGAGGVIIKYDGAAWATQTSPITSDLKSVSMVVSNLGWAVGDDGKIVKWNGTSWATQTSPTASGLNGVSMDSGGAFGVAVGVGGVIAHYNGTSWATVASPTANELKSVSLLSATQGFAVGASGAIIRWNGTAWSSVASPTGADLFGVHYLDATHAWAVGAGGVIVRWNGTAWAMQTSPVATDLKGVEARSASEVWAVGASGTILEYDGSAWTTYASPTSQHLFSVTVKAPTDGWIVGNGGTVLKDPGPYFLTGTFTSSVLDTDAGSATWDAFFATETLPTNTSITVAFHSGNVAVPDGTWTAWSSELPLTTGTLIPVTAARYLQYRATLTTTDSMVTPDFDNITVTYHK